MEKCQLEEEEEEGKSLCFSFRKNLSLLGLKLISKTPTKKEFRRGAKSRGYLFPPHIPPPARKTRPLRRGGVEKANLQTCPGTAKGREGGGGRLPFLPPARKVCAEEGGETFLGRRRVVVAFAPAFLLLLRDFLSAAFAGAINGGGRRKGPTEMGQMRRTSGRNFRGLFLRRRRAEPKTDFCSLSLSFRLKSKRITQVRCMAKKYFFFFF